VATQEEQSAFDELEEIISRMENDTKQEAREDYYETLKSAISVLPNVDSIRFECPNPFRHRILRKCWEEYDFQVITCPVAQGTHVFNVLHAAKETGLAIRHFIYERLLALYFSQSFSLQLVADGLASDLDSLSLNILVFVNTFVTEAESQAFQALLMQSPRLRKLDISFEGFAVVPVTVFPSHHFPSLESLSIIANTTEENSGQLLDFITMHSSSLRELQIVSMKLESDNTFRGVMERLRNELGGTLERFQICGSIMEGEREMMIFPHYNKDWTPYRRRRTSTAKKLEDFLLREGPWPDMPPSIPT